jgi:two-component system, cell cycle response regulator CpdR
MNQFWPVDVPAMTGTTVPSARCCQEGGCEERIVPRIVLVVDDEPLVLDVTASMLEDLGCEVITAAGGQDALQKLHANRRIEVLITDINMPGMNGYALANAALQIRRGLKVIVLSGRQDHGGGFPLVRKPFLREDLRRTMATYTGLC